ncbi:integrator complex subunit 10-like isoform X3 [Pomacea canaliculata]|uniref:integrator complex subunit 10-like isoform X3 n=1 Tax=Pomacea canaliculata TaxID=400727 RepID=UPI000D73B999|nr:integrator complex subunit 10-like isoform X3 [Pomacea canaliculata]
MATAGMYDSLSDVDYLVMRARQYSKTDQYAAKAWLITAKSLFPTSFVIQFESYQVEKAGRNVNEAAKQLEEMFRNFPNERQLWEEVQNVLEALQTDSSDQRQTFLTEIFAAIPTHIQCQMLLSVADKISSTLEQCRLLLLAMKNFPNLVQEHGLKLVDLLIMEETKVPGLPAVNCYRKLLVCDVMPLLLNRGLKQKLPADVLYSWLRRAIEFYISYVTQPSIGDPSSSVGADLLSPTKASIKRLPPVAGLLERENQVIDPWGSLFNLLLLLGHCLDWEFEPDIFNKSREVQWQYIVSQFNRAKQTHSDGGYKQVLHMAVVLFIQSFYFYVSHVEANIAAGNSSGGATTPVVLIEGFPPDMEEHVPHPRVKKQKTDGSNQPPIYPSSSISNAQTLVSNFTMALKCFELLNTREELRRDFLSLYGKWNKETWAWISNLQIDMALYQGNFQDAIAQIQNFLDTASGKMKCTEKEILPYCIQLLVASLKERMYSTHCSDAVLAHLIILLQNDWPQQESLFLNVIKHIQRQGSFTYNMFFSYVFVVDILEEFAFLDTAEGGRINLDILPTSTKTLAQQRTVTRGVNKGVKEDFRAALEKQVGRLQEPCQRIIRKFLREERTAFLQNM